MWSGYRHRKRGYAFRRIALPRDNERKGNRSCRQKSAARLWPREERTSLLIYRSNSRVFLGGSFALFLNRRDTLRRAGRRSFSWFRKGPQRQVGKRAVAFTSGSVAEVKRSVRHACQPSSRESENGRRTRAIRLKKRRTPRRSRRGISEPLAPRSVKREKRERQRRGWREDCAEEGELTCYDGPENENNETKQCRADVTVN